jgi:hypothetical protein
LWVLVGFLGFFLWASWVVPVHTTCVLKGALHFFNKISLLIKKKYFIRPVHPPLDQVD